MRKEIGLPKNNKRSLSYYCSTRLSKHKKMGFETQADSPYRIKPKEDSKHKYAIVKINPNNWEVK